MESTTVTEIHSFEDMGLEENLLRGIYSSGWEKPTPIQSKAIVPASSGRDIIIHAQSGTGKTGTFVTSVLTQIDPSKNEIQGLILSPVRELALQTEEVVKTLGQFMGIKCHASVGGRSGREDMMALRNNPHVVTGTPGRVLGNLNRGIMRSDSIKMIVLDETDVLLEKGFEEQMRGIFQQLPGNIQAMLVTATFGTETQLVADQLLRDPVKVLIPKEQITLEGIKQYYINCEKDDYKADVLLDLYNTLSVAQSIIFCNTQRKAQRLAEYMDANEFTISLITGEMSQQEREEIIKTFKSGATRVLIATDILARGIDAPSVSAVMNFDIPYDHANYIHRIGRCGRMGKKGVAINLITDSESRNLQEIEKYYSTVIPQMPSDFASHLN